MTMEKDPNLLYRVLEEGFEVDSPEAIAKWRDSRRRNFPTTSNIHRKETHMADTVLRGEKFLPKRLNRKIFRYPIKEDKGKEKYHHQQHNAIPISSWVNRRLPENKSEVLLLDSYYAQVEVDPTSGVLIRTKHTLWEPTLRNEVVDEGEDEDINTDTESFNGKALAMDCNVSITDDEDEPTHESNEKLNPVNPPHTVSLPLPATVPPVPAPALQSLVAYGTDSDLEEGEIEGDVGPSVVPFVPCKINCVEALQGPPASQKYAAGTPDKAHPPTAPPPKNNQPKKRKRKKRTQKPNQNPSGAQQRLRGLPQKKRMRRCDREPTLLRRLLDDEICEERNAVLCGSRFLVQHKFLEGMENSEDVKAEFIDCLRSSSIPEEDQ